MKKLLLTISLITLISCSKSPEAKALKLIEEKFKKTLDDYDSYELVEISKLDSIFTKPSDDFQFNLNVARYRELENLISILKHKREHFFDEITKDSIKNFGLHNLKSTNTHEYIELENKIADMTKEMRDIDIVLSRPIVFTPQFKGYKATHRFRANNESGIKKLYIYKWEFNTTIDTIRNQEIIK